MRTTVTLDPDTARLLEDEVHRARKPFKQVLNDAIRRGLSPRGSSARPPRYEPPVHSAKLLPGIDPAKLNSLTDELDEQASAARHRSRRRSS